MDLDEPNDYNGNQVIYVFSASPLSRHVAPCLFPFVVSIDVLILSFSCSCNFLQNKQSVSTHEKELEKLRSEIEEMEKANLEPKTWTMQGEVIFTNF